MDGTSRRIANGIIWRISQQYGVYFIKLIVQTVMARILMPEEFGLIAKIAVFITITEAIALSGLGSGLVQKKDADEKDFATCLAMSMALAAIMYALLFFSAPALAAYFGSLEMISVLRFYGIALFINSYASIQGAYVLKIFAWRKSFISSTISSTISGIIGIVLAYKGCGVWALVLSSLIGGVIGILTLHLLVKWKPLLKFDMERSKSLFSYSWKVAVGGATSTLMENLYSLTIGKYYGDAYLGYYNRGSAFPSVILGQIRTAIGSVLFPSYSKIQNNREALRISVSKMTRITCFIIFPMAVGLAAIAGPIISLLLTDKWLPAVFYMRLDCVFYGLLAITNATGNAISAIGRSDINLKAEIIKIIAALTCILTLNQYGIKLLCIMRLVIAVGIIIYYIIMATNLIGYDLKELVHDVWKPLISSIIMGIPVYLVSLANLKSWVTLLIQIFIGCIVYSAIAIIFFKDTVCNAILIIRSVIKKY